MENNKAMTAEEVAEQLKIAKNTVYELIKRGELRSYKVGRKVRIDSQDLEAYIRKSKGDSREDIDEALSLSKQSDYSMNRDQPLLQRNMVNDFGVNGGFVLSGQDTMLDILANMLQNHKDGVPTLRSFVGSFQGLGSLYYDQSNMAAIHLWDGDSDTYNIPYVHYMVPGVPCIIIHLAKRVQGFYVKKGNPKDIKDWFSLTKEGVTFVNREKGSGTRVLLDEKMRQLSMTSSDIRGYFQEKTSHFAVANAIATGKADVGIGCEAAAMRFTDIEFIPLQTEHYDLVMKKENLGDPTYRLVYDLLCSDEFKENVESLKGYDFSELGQIVAET